MNTNTTFHKGSLHPVSSVRVKKSCRILWIDLYNVFYLLYRTRRCSDSPTCVCCPVVAPRERTVGD
ncbi:hypothetical protein M3J09_008922 [Ascochyta lentis]